MDYSEFESRIGRLATAATDSARRSFAIDSVRKLAHSAAPAAADELTEPEQRLLSDLVEGIEARPVDELLAISEALLDSMTTDDERAADFDEDLVELLTIIDAWLLYRGTGEPSYIAEIAIGMANSVDTALQDQDRDCSPHDMLGTPEMRGEFDRIERLLTR